MMLEAHLVEDAEEILRLAQETEVVGIDEGQFFGPNLVSVCKTLAKQKKRVVAGLNTDYRGEPFGPMPTLMCEADYLDKL